MFDTGRRSATSTSELGLYSDRSDHYHRNRYGFGVRKYVIGVMVVLAIILISVLLYDFTSSARVVNHGAKETKHIYILQNALKKPVSPFQKSSSSTTASPSNVDSNRTALLRMEDRSDRRYNRDDDISDSEELEDKITSETRSIVLAKSNPQFRHQNMDNFNMRKRLLSMDENESEEKVGGKQLFGNHAMVYRLRQRYKNPVSEEDTSFEETRPMPFHFEYKTPVPSSFKRPKYPQLSQYRYPQSSNNIQDIIKYLTNDNENPNRGIKFSGVYVNPKKFDFYPEAGEMISNSDKSEEENPAPYSFSFNSDPLYQYKPKNPSDVNLLATSNLRFSPSVFHRRNPSHSDPYYPRPPLHFNTQSSSSESQYDHYDSHTTASIGKKRKPKPFSVMLDIYPIPDTVDPNRESSRPRSGPSNQQTQVPPEEYEIRRPISHIKPSKHSPFSPSSQPISLVAIPGPQTNLDDEDRQQMIFHLNLYPRRRNRVYRNDIIPRSQRTDHSIEEHIDEKMPTPFDTIVKHLTDHSAIQVSKFENTQLSDDADVPIIDEDTRNTRYEESELDRKNQESLTDENQQLKQDREISVGAIPRNHKPEFTAENIAEKSLDVSNENVKDDSKNSEITELVKEDSKSVEESEKTIGNRNIDTVEGFEDFADGLLATD